MKHILGRMQGALKVGLYGLFIGVAIFAFSPRQAQAGGDAGMVELPGNVYVEMGEDMC